MLLQIKVLGRIYFICLYILVNVIYLLFIKKQTKKLAKATELFANIYIISIYFSMVLLII